MTFHHRPYHVRKAAQHLLDSAGFYTKDDGSPLEVLARKFGDHASDMLKKLGATNDDLAGIKAQLLELEQKAARGNRGGYDAPPKSIGAQFVESDRVKAFLDGEPSSGRIDLRIKATLTTLTTDAAGSVGSTASPAYRDSIVVTPRRRRRVRDLLPVINISSGSAEWPSQKGRTDGAAPVAETSAKPQSDIQFEMKTASAKVIAHWMKASKQVLSDAPQLRGIIDTELLDGLALEEEDQLLTGDNTGQNLYGLIPQATAYAAPESLADINVIDVIALAALQVNNSHYEADGAIVNSGDWLIMRTLKNSQGDYILGSPIQSVDPNLWGLPIVATPAMTSRKFLVGQFRTAATIYDRWDARIEVGYVNDDFTKNLVTILAEERLALGVKQPLALVYGDFDTAIAA